MSFSYEKSNINILILGDSIDQFIITDSCVDIWNGTLTSGWSTLFTYKNTSGTTGCY